MIAAIINQFKFLETIGDYISFITEVFFQAFRKIPSWKLVREQLYAFGVQSLAVVTLTGFSMGLVLATQSYYQLADKGLSAVTGLMVAKAMLTEIGPVLTAFMITGRVGASMTAELGTMNVTEQIDAMQSMAVNPLRYLVAPRFLSGFIMFPLLTMYSIVMGVFGGYLISIYFFDMAPSTFWDPIPMYVDMFDFWVGLIKSIVFGVLIVTLCCYKGIKAGGGAKGVGIATTSAVVTCYVIILFLNFLLTLGMNVIHAEISGWSI